jgi:hypothetical protein
MYLLLEHSGSAEHNKFAEHFQDFAESEFGYTCEDIIGDSNGPTTLYTEDMKKVAEFAGFPDDTELYFYLTHYIDDEK